MSSRRLDSPRRKQQIAEAALRLLAETPLPKLGTRALARELGITQPAIFRHFRSREDILVAAVDHARETLADELSQHSQCLAEPKRGIAALAGTLLDFAETYPGLPRLLFADGTEDFPKLRAALNRMISMQNQLLVHWLEQGRDAGALRSVDTQAAATLFIGMIQGLVLEWRRTGRPTGLRARADRVLAIWNAGVWRDDASDAKEIDRDAPASRREGQTGKKRSCGVDVEFREIDVRPHLDAGVDPLGVILDILKTLAPGAALHVAAPFEPRPLVRLLEAKGHVLDAARLSDGSWSLIVVVDGLSAVRDLRELESPEPLQAVLEESAVQRPYVARLPRYPRALEPLLRERGLLFRILETSDRSSVLWIAP